MEFAFVLAGWTLIPRAQRKHVVLGFLTTGVEFHPRLMCLEDII